MKSLRFVIRIVAILLIVISIAILVLFTTGAILYKTADMAQPNVNLDTDSFTVVNHENYLSCNGNKLRHSNDSIWELYLQGDALNRSLSYALMASDIVRQQENVFIDQIKRYIPSDSYFNFLRYLIFIFNRNLGQYIPDEYRVEILGLSTANTHDYDAFGSPYERQINYNAAHDIGHMMQDYMLVGCSSFAAWNAASADSSLIIARNFDFYFGDDFSRNKLLMFVNPDAGFKFVSISWPGMIGVVSGMNARGLTVTINASKGAIPTSSKTPISILARQILQYASTIDEAVAIADSFNTFVSESLLIGSAIDGRAAVIEKTPEQMSVFESDTDYVVCTNHYQSEELKYEPRNIENIESSDSKYRLETMRQSVKELLPIDATKAASIMRQQLGYNKQDIGVGNEYSLNQSLAHHLVIFEPCALRMWVSTAPWQSGALVCYDLNRVFSDTVDWNNEIATHSADVIADSSFIKHDYNRIVQYRQLVEQIKVATKQRCIADSLLINKALALNPNYYHAHQLAGYFWENCGFQIKAKQEFDEADRLRPSLK